MSFTLEAGRAALDRGAWEAAEEAFQRSLAEGETPAALEGLGWALFWLDRTEEAMDARERAFRLYREAGDARAAARLAYGLAVDCIDLRGEASATGWLERARRLLEGLEPTAEHGWLALWEGHFALLYRRDAGTARARGEAAREMGRQFALFDLEMLAVALDGLVQVASGRVEDGMRRLDEATSAALAGEMNDLDAVGATCCLLVHACERVRDYDRAAQWADRVARFTKAWGIAPALTVCRTQHAAMLIGRGEWAQAEEELQRAAERLAASRPLLLAEALEQLGELRRRQGRWEEAEALFARVEGRSLALLGRGVIALESGEAATAADLLERFLRRTPADNWSGRAAGLEQLARARLALGQRALAEDALAALRELAEHTGTPTSRAVARQTEGVLATHDGRWEEARRLLEDAVDLFLQAQAPFEAARARLDLCRSLEGAGRRDPAAREARSALQIFDTLGATRESAWAAALVDQPTGIPDGGPMPSGAGAGHGFGAGSCDGDDGGSRLDHTLTARELEVLRLIAQGLGDKAIASRLNLSGHTVHRHVSNIRVKLGLPSRAAAVAWAAQNGVL